jgi:hypothetical protein
MGDCLGVGSGIPSRRPGDPLREALAQKIIAPAKAGERASERLCEGALKALRAPDPLTGSPLPASCRKGDQAAEG